MSIKRAFHHASILLTVTVLAAACTTRNEKTVVEHARQAPAEVKQSFRLGKADTANNTAEAAPGKQEDRMIRLRKSSLGKAFLLMPSLKTAAAAARWEDFSPTVVLFERSGSSLGLFEMTTPVYEQIKAENLLGTFAIAQETEDEIAFEWIGGLKSMPLRPHYAGILQSASEKSAEDEGNTKGLTIKDSFVRKAGFEGNRLNIEQVIRAQVSRIANEGLKTAGDHDKAPKLVVEETSFVARFEISPYNPSKTFVPRDRDPQRRMEFFGVNAIKDGRSSPRALAMTWDLSPERGPIRILLSKSIPAQYLNAVKEGALYWNKVAGREIMIPVENSEADVAEDRSILIRWIPWNDAGMAYASMQADPFTGEILRAQVFMTAVFANVRNIGDDVADSAQMKVSPFGLTGTRLCTLTRRNMPALNSFTGTTAKVANDLIRFVVAHEVGHNMGFRHNFAGTLGGLVDSAKVNEEVANYRADVNHQGLELSSTVMDYLAGTDEAATGGWIRNNALTYDKVALNYLATGELPADDKIPAFCADDELMLAGAAGLKILGCAQNDNGANIAISKTSEASMIIRTKLTKALETAYGKMFPLHPLAKRKTVKEAAEELGADLSLIGFDLAEFRRMIYVHEKDGKDVETLLSIEEAKEQLEDLDPYEKLMTAEDSSSLSAKLKKQWSEAGGVAKAFRTILRLNEQNEISTDWIKAEVDFVVARYPFQKGRLRNGVAYEITAEQAQELRDAVRKSVDENKVFASMIQALMPGTAINLDMVARKAVMAKFKNRNGVLESADSQAVGDMAAKLLLAKGKTITVNTVPAQEIAIPRLSVAARKALLTIFDSTLWGTTIPSTVTAPVKEDALVRLRLLSSLAPSPSSTVQDELQRLQALLTQALASGRITLELYLVAAADMEVLKEIK